MRRNVTFWLYDQREADSDLLRYIGKLKKARQFSGAIRDGLRLIRDLRAGNLDVLFELFPWIERALYDALDASQEPSGDAGQVSKAEIKAAVREALKESQGDYVQKPALVTGNLKALNQGSGKPVPGPNDSDDLLDLLEVKDVTDTGGKATENFIASMMAMQAVKSDKAIKATHKVARIPDASEIVISQHTQ